MNVSLTPELERLVQDKAQSARYLSACELVRIVLRLLEERDLVRELNLQELGKFVSVGIGQADRTRPPPRSGRDVGTGEKPEGQESRGRVMASRATRFAWKDCLKKRCLS
jgi:antitoxin ParD1/3/4